MQFKHPELLWALFLLIIPILIHLFKLRRFKKEPFTNVQILKELRRETRKSSQIKKWLVLLTRMLTYTSIIMAFAQPYLANRNVTDTAVETVIYLDDSFSMQLQGQEGTLLQEAVNQLIKNIPGSQKFSLFTNDRIYENVRLENVKNKILSISYVSKQLSMNEIFIRGSKLFAKTNAVKNLILISDFQNREQLPDTLQNIRMHYVQLSPVVKNNISIDSAYISEKRINEYTFQVQLTQHGDMASTPVSLFDGDRLMAKTAVDFSNNNAEVAFTIPTEIKAGRITVTDNGLQYDNALYFSLNEVEKINVLSINEADDGFLQRIFTDDEFNYTPVASNAVDFNRISQQDLIILNEVGAISTALSGALQSARRNGIKICCIASGEQQNIPFNNITFKQHDPIEKPITGIAFDHPLFKNVFEERVRNFQYPKASSSYQMEGTFNSVISFADGQPFLAEIEGDYIFTTALNREDSNFQNSPLIVPVFYNMAKQSLALPQLYYSIGMPNVIDIRTTISNDEILTIANQKNAFIPLQQSYNDRVSLTTGELPEEAGTYSVMKKDKTLNNISFNYNKNESTFNYLQITGIAPEQAFENIPDAFESIKSENNVDELWKWFVIFALVFLCTELLILKYFK